VSIKDRIISAPEGKPQLHGEKEKVEAILNDDKRQQPSVDLGR
jgi:hypothetical protein